jgi:hypothetical protein
MHRLTALVCAIVIGIVTIGPTAATGHSDPNGQVVTVAFGPGLNTLPPSGPSGPANHHVVPNRIQVSVGDIIHFVVAGFHQIRIYQPGVRLADVINLLPPECRENPAPASCAAAGVSPLIPLDSPNDLDTAPDLPTYYEGLPPSIAPVAVTINSATGAAQVALPSRSSAQNRLETVSFAEPGRYLVICTILGHFNDRMIAWVEVGRSGRKDDRGHGPSLH